MGCTLHVSRDHDAHDVLRPGEGIDEGPDGAQGCLAARAVARDPEDALLAVFLQQPLGLRGPDEGLCRRVLGPEDLGGVDEVLDVPEQALGAAAIQPGLPAECKRSQFVIKLGEPNVGAQLDPVGVEDSGHAHRLTLTGRGRYFE